MSLARSLDSYFRCNATAVIRCIADEFIVSIETDTGWYVEPPPRDSMMEALHQVKVWARDNSADVTVIEDLDNADFRSAAKKGQAKSPRSRLPLQLVPNEPGAQTKRRRQA